MPTNSPNFNIPKPLTTEVFNLTNFNAVLDAIDANIKAKLDEKVASADYVKSPGYAVATGSANAYSVTLTPAPTSYVEGMGVKVKINIDSTGASTLNVNGLGAKPIKKANGSDVTNLKANGIYTVLYTSGNFILQGEGGEYGNVTAADVLQGKLFGTEAGVQTGTLIQGKRKVSGTITSASTTVSNIPNETGATGTSYAYIPFNMANIPFVPYSIEFIRTDKTSKFTTMWRKNNHYVNGAENANVAYAGNNLRVSYVNGVVNIPVNTINTSYDWVAYEE